MKILQVITSLHTGGAEKLIVEMVPLYIEQGHEVEVLLFDGTDTPFKRQLQAKGVKIHELRKGGNVYNPLNILRLLPYLKKYDIVHTHNTACQLFAAIGSVLCSVVLVTTEHSTSNRRRDWKWYRGIDRWMYSRYKAVICISDKAKENLCRYLGKTSNNILAIYNGINLQTFQSTKENTSLKQGKIIITMVARFTYQKDQETLIRSLLYLPQSKYMLWLVGDGERRPILESLVKELGLESAVRLWGNRDDVPVLLKSSDIIVMSSHFEGLSLSNIEGMAVGHPFIASDVDGLHEATEGAGILFPHGDAEALAHEITKLMDDKAYYRQIADRCMARAAQYDIHKTVNAYLGVYKSLAKH